MAEYQIKLFNGYTYYCGLTLPWYVSKGMVENELEKGGFTNFAWHDRSTPLPSNVNPKKSPIYDDSWELWLVGVYFGPDGIGTLPAQPAWVMMVKPNETPTKPPASSAGEKKNGSGLMTAIGIALAVIGVGIAARRSA